MAFTGIALCLRALCLVASWLAAWGADALAVDLDVTPQRIEVTGSTQRWRCDRDPDGGFRLTTFVRGRINSSEWNPLFDAGRPLVEGADFDLVPTEISVDQSDAARVVLLLGGRQAEHGFPWEARVAFDDRTPLVHLIVTCHLAVPITLRGLEPQLALWRRKPTVALALDQGPGSIDQGPAARQWGNSFPAAYLWDEGQEAALFIVGESLDWMSPRNLFRFRDCRAACLVDPARGQSGIGLQVVKRNFHELAASDVTFEAWIHAAAAPKPTKSEALARLTRLFGPLHPRHAQPLIDRLTGAPMSWGSIAEGVDGDLRRRGVVCDDVYLPAGSPWSDRPLFPEDVVARLPIATDQALGSSCDPARDRASVADGWDFSTCHNGLAGWLVHDRLHPDPARHAFLVAKTRGLRLFFDPDCGLIRHGTRHPPHVGDKEMAWQSLMFAIEAARTWQALERGDVDPAIGGILLLGADGLEEMAKANGHLLPQWFDPVTKRPLPQADQPDLGVVFEPWQLGSLAWLQTEAHRIDGDPKRLDDAVAAIERLFAPLRWQVSNPRYDVDYDDTTDYPVTEIFGNAWGVAACCRLRELTGDDRFDRFGDAFLDTLLRLTSWYESALRDDPRDRAVRNAGLFRNHAGAFTGSPWENSEVALALSVRIRHDLLRGASPREPLLALMNLQRVNAATFFPRCCPDEAQACPRLADHPAASLPIEDAYTPEHGGLHGGMGRSAYMAGAAFAYELLFAAAGTVDTGELMALNLDAIEGSEAALRGLARHLVVYNPLHERRQATLRPAPLPDGRYRVTIGTAPPLELSADDLGSGLSISVAAGGHLAVTIERLEADSDWSRLTADRQQADRLAAEWAALHRDLRRDGQTPAILGRRDAWRRALVAFREPQPIDE